jgi:RNA polymerase sigma-70 factor, ECF subfamily
VSGQAEFEAMFNAHAVAVYRYALRRVGPDLAHDAVSEVFMVAWRRQHDVEGQALPWLLGIARRVCANQLRARSRAAELHERLAGEPRPWAPTAAIEDDALRRALAVLSDPDREALYLIAWEGLDNAQAARVLGCARGTFAVRLHRARGRLRRALERDERAELAEANGRTVANEAS